MIIHNSTPREGSYSGFTLIELLVVISIIGLLASISLVGLSTARSKARDAKRKSEVLQLAKGINMYVDVNGSGYPVANGSACIGLSSTQQCWSAISYISIKGNDALNTSLKTVMKTLPVDPTPSRTAGDHYLYTDTRVMPACGVVSSWGHFILWEPESGPPHSDGECQGVGIYACCGDGNPCNVSEGYYCALKID